MLKNIRNNTIIITLLVLILAQGGLCYWVLQHKIWLVKKEMKELIMGNAPENQLTHIHLSKIEYENLEWEEPWEFEFNGNMYDISRKEFHDDGTVTLHAVLDSEENELKLLARALVKNSPSKKQTQENLDTFYKIQSHWICEYPLVFKTPTLVITQPITKSKSKVTLPFTRQIELPPDA